MKKLTALFGRLCATALVIFLLFWFLLPALNPRSQDFWLFVILSIGVFVVINAFAEVKNFFLRLESKKSKLEKKKVVEVQTPMGKLLKVSIGIVVLIIAVSALATGIGSPLFHASSYHQLITLQDGDFADDVAELTMEQIPVVDHDTAIRLGKRKLGEMSDLVSQFEIDETYTQINYKDHPVRVTPLRYADPIKWFNNQKNGIPAYIKVDMTTQETQLVHLEQGIRYSESEYFMRNIHRLLRFSYPTKIFDTVSFEIDEEGTPYWIASTVDFRIFWWNGRDIDGAVLVNAITGESQYYPLEEIPNWADQVYDSSIVMEQLTYNGLYRSGFWNSIIGQKGVLQPTEGYNYIAIDDDVYLYTGMTSVTSDESNVGFVLVNLRTKEAKYYQIPGAEEFSAMGSAEGQVQNLKYVSTFPILLNISDRPTYFMSLKDGAGLVKMYAFVDVEQYQIVGTGNTVDEARADYTKKLYSEKDIEVKEYESETISGVIRSIQSAVVGGNTKYYLLLTGNDTPFVVDVTTNDLWPFAQAGDQVTLTVENRVDELVVTAAEITVQKGGER